MKTFRQYLQESKKQYKFQIKLTFKPDNDLLDDIEKALARFDIDSISAPKSLPISRQDKDFPGLDNPETYVLQVVLNFPTTADFVRHTIAAIGLETEQVAVSSLDHADSVMSEEDKIAKNSGQNPLLQSEYENQSNKDISDDNFGSAYNDKLVKNAAGSMETIVPKEFRKNKAETTNELPQGKKSAISGTNKIPKVSSFSSK